jgi:hypothetical protein
MFLAKLALSWPNGVGMTAAEGIVSISVAEI